MGLLLGVPAGLIFCLPARFLLLAGLLLGISASLQFRQSPGLLLEVPACPVFDLRADPLGGLALAGCEGRAGESSHPRDVPLCDALEGEAGGQDDARFTLVEHLT